MDSRRPLWRLFPELLFAILNSLNAAPGCWPRVSLSTHGPVPDLSVGGFSARPQVPDGTVELLFKHGLGMSEELPNTREALQEFSRRQAGRQTHTDTHTHAHAHTQTGTHTHTQTGTHTHTYRRAHTHIHIHTHTQAGTHTETGTRAHTIH